MDPAGYFNVELTDDEFELFRTILENETGIVLKESKRQLVRNRLRPLLEARGRRRFSELLDGLCTPDERQRVLSEITDAITTNLTEFFREAHQFDVLRDSALPGLLALLESDLIRRVSIWSAGCSTGQEPYSLAMFLKETVPGHLFERFRIRATDIDRRALDIAKEAIYAPEEVEPLGSLRARAGFTRLSDGRYQVSPALRSIVRFGVVNLSRPSTWGYATYHLIFCRNVMIYFSPDLRTRLVESLVERLHPGGFLFLGHAEGGEGAAQKAVEYAGPSAYRKAER